MTGQQFSYQQAQGFPGLQSGLPYLPLTLIHHEHTVTSPALVDSGATVNVLPHDIGLDLGLTWGKSTLPLAGEGFLRGLPTYGVLLRGTVHPFPSVRLVFAWSQRTSQEIPLILGQMNFFHLFKVTFDGKAGTFEIVMNT